MGATIKVGDIAHLRAITPDYYIHTFRNMPNICFRFKRPAAEDFEYLEVAFVLDRHFRTSVAARDNLLGTYNAAILKALQELTEKSYFTEHFGEGWELVLKGARQRLDATSLQPMNKISVGLIPSSKMAQPEPAEQMKLFDTPKKSPHREGAQLKSFLQINLSRLAFFETVVGDNSLNRDAWGPGKVSGTVNVFDEDFRFNVGHPYHPVKGTITEEEILRCLQLELDQNFPWILRHDLFRNVRFD
jgi:hypothetical protein